MARVTTRTLQPRPSGMRTWLTLVACMLLAGLALTATAQAAAPRLSTTFDGTGTPDGSMTPNRLAVDESTGDIYVIDSAHDVVNRFSSTGTYISQLRGSATTTGNFALGGGDDDIAVDNSGTATQGNVYVVGENNGATSGSEVSAFNAAGTFLWQVVPRQGIFDDTCGVAVDAAGNVWTADYYQGVQQRSVTDGSVLVNGVNPRDACQIAIDVDNALYLTHWQASLEKIQPPAPWNGGDSATVDFGANRDVAVNSVTNDVFTSHGTDVVAYDSAGTMLFGGPFAAGTPLGVTVDGPSDRVYISDKANGTVQIWTLPHTLTVTVDGSGGGRVDADSGAIAGCTSSGGTCSDTYDDGTEVTLTATPDAHSTVSWSGGGCSGSGSTCRTTLTGATAVIQQSRRAG